MDWGPRGVAAVRWALAVAGRRGRGGARARPGQAAEGEAEAGEGSHQSSVAVVWAQLAKWRQSLGVGAVRLVQGAMR